MARHSKKLTALDVKNITKPGRHADGDGLYLNVAKGGSKSWIFWFMRAGRRREMGLGGYPSLSLADAREKAAGCRRALANGGDPFAIRQAEPKTFGEAADALVESLDGSWRNAKHSAQWRMTLGDKYCRSLRPKHVDQVSTEDVLKVLTPIWQTKPETASRVRGRIERVLDFAQVRGWRSGENPARWRGHLKNALPARKKLTRGHHAAMPYQDVPGFLARLQAAEAMSARGLELLILTTARSGEVLGAQWDEVDLDKALWVIPAARMKAGKEHRVPLVDRAIDILRPLYDLRVSEYVFPGERQGRPLSVMAFTMLMRRLKVGHFTPHGFRSAFRDWAGDCTSFPRELAEAALAHRVGDETERAYRRADALERRKQLMQTWASYLLP